MRLRVLLLLRPVLVLLRPELFHGRLVLLFQGLERLLGYLALLL